ncbi:MAG TPA: hypothetical protein VGK99_03955 [Acidobacteriota bacterium]|jgi:hypothetical protein
MAWQLQGTVGEEALDRDGSFVDLIMADVDGTRILRKITLTHRNFRPDFDNYEGLGITLISLVLHDQSGRTNYPVNDAQLRSALVSLRVDPEDEIWDGLQPTKL